MSDQALGRLFDRKRLAQELGVTRAAVDRIFRELPTVQLPGFRREWVRERDVEGLLERHTRTEA